MTGSETTSSALPSAAPPSVSLDDISAGREIAQADKTPDTGDALERKTLENDKLRAAIETLRSGTRMREGYEKKVYRYLVGYSAGAFVLLGSSGMGWMHLSDSVLLTISGSTALAAIGLVSQIGKGLFRSGSAE